MQALARYVMSDRNKAILVATLLSVMFFLPLTHWLSLSILALVTLVKGPRQGGVVFVWMILPSVALGVTTFPNLLWEFVLLGACATWALSSIFYYTRSWILTLECGTGVAVLVIWGLHGWNPHLIEEWLPKLRLAYDALSDLVVDAPVSEAQVNQLLKQQAFYATGMSGAVYLFRVIFAVALGRYMQSLLYHPGGFREEFINLRLDKVASLVLFAFFLMGATGLAYAQYVLPVLLIPCLVLMASMIHGFSDLLQPGWLGIFIGYTSLAVFLPYSLTLWIMLVVFEPWLDLRSKLKYWVK